MLLRNTTMAKVGKESIPGLNWAKSHRRFDYDETPGCDLHNLKPIEGSINNSRGNLDFDYGGKRYKTSS
jgi:endonuclease I